MNGTIHHQQALSEEEEEDTPESDNPPQTNGDSAPEDDQNTADDVTTSHQEQETEPHMERHVPDNVLSPAAANIAVETDAPHIDAQKAPHSPEDNVYPQTTESNDFTPVITAEVHRADTEPEDMEFTPPPPSPPPDRKSTRLNSSHLVISYAVFCLKKKNHISTFIHTELHSIRCTQF